MTTTPPIPRRAGATGHRRRVPLVRVPAQPHPSPRTPARTLAIDVGGTDLKASVLGPSGRMIAARVWVATPYPCPPKVLVKTLVELVKPLPAFDRVAIGFPGYVRGDEVITAPHFGNGLWRGFNLVAALSAKFGRPVRLLNDADLQGLAAIQGRGLELVVTLGTGVGTGLYRDGELMPHLELAHHPVHKGKDYNGYVGNPALKQAGKKRWNRRVQRVIKILHALCEFDTIYLGGGNSRHLTCKSGARLKIISNEDGILGGFRLWEPVVPHPRAAPPPKQPHAAVS